MKIKQLETLRKQHRDNLERKPLDKPSMNKAIALAIISGQPIKLKKHANILKAAQTEIADCQCRYSSSERTLKFSEIFDFNSDELATYEKAKKQRDGMIAAYSKKADRILLSAEMNEAVDPVEASEQLTEAAHEAGLL